MKGLEEIIADNEAAHSSKYMRKFVLVAPSWVTGEQMAARAQNYLTSEVLFHDSKDKKFLVTITAEEV